MVEDEEDDKQPIFDFDAGERLKEEGQNRAAVRRLELLQFARDGLENIARSRESREVTADDATRYLVENGESGNALGAAAGSLFRGKQWEFTGRWVKSEKVTNHASDLRVWRLK